MQRSDFRFCFRFAFLFLFLSLQRKLALQALFSTVCVIIILTSYLRLGVVKTRFSLNIILYIIIQNIIYNIIYIDNILYIRVCARDRVRVCHAIMIVPYLCRNLPFFAIFLFIHILCCDILLLRLFFMIFVIISDFITHFTKFFAKNLA